MQDGSGQGVIDARIDQETLQEAGYWKFEATRSHVEYCVPVWNPSLARDIACLESIQCRATKIVAGFHNKPDNERLHLLGLRTLEKRSTEVT